MKLFKSKKEAVSFILALVVVVATFGLWWAYSGGYIFSSPASQEVVDEIDELEQEFQELLDSIEEEQS